MDDGMIEILRQKTRQSVLEIAFGVWRSPRAMLTRGPAENPRSAAARDEVTSARLSLASIPRRIY
jgi:hypothetical protein